MSKTLKKTIKMKVFPKGQVVIPISLREKYHIEIGDQIDVISESDGIHLKPVQKETNKRSMTDRLFGIFSTYAAGKPAPNKKDIQGAVETGFTEGWKE